MIDRTRPINVIYSIYGKKLEQDGKEYDLAGNLITKPEEPKMTHSEKMKLAWARKKANG